MPKHAFSHVETWVFDLDNTLYPPEDCLFDQIESRMTAWVSKALNVDTDTANQLRKDYWSRYGTTLAGLMREHQIDPAPYLTDVHDISFDALHPDPELAKAIKALPGRAIVYTNGCEPYARNVLKARGLESCFDAVFGVEHAGFHPKPERKAFDTIIALDGFAADRAAMFEDDPRNLEAPKALGMRTVHVAPKPSPRAYIEYHTADLTAFLNQLT